MPVVIDVGVADLAATRFATSPLAETVRAVRVLADPAPHGLNLPWVRWAERHIRTRPLRVELLRPLIVSVRRTTPEFLVPAPVTGRPDIDEQLATLRATQAVHVRASLRRVFGSGHWPAGATELYRRPRSGLRELADELRETFDRVIAPHWPRMRAVLDADIAYRARLLSEGGARRLFADLHPGVCWADGRITVADPGTPAGVRSVILGPDGLVLVPSVLCWPFVPVKLSTTTQTTMTYPARGIGALWEIDRHDAPGSGIVGLLGAQRARILQALRSPSTNGELARALQVTPSAVSQHLAALHAGGLVGRERVGRSVLYLASELGLALLGA